MFRGNLGSCPGGGDGDGDPDPLLYFIKSGAASWRRKKWWLSKKWHSYSSEVSR